MYDVIGDIHGHADELVSLLQKLEYTKVNGVYQHAERQVIFLGDFIDRGPKVRETLQIVRPMIESGSALAVMGNHEFNFLCYNHQLPDGSWLRKHKENNKNQVAATVKAFEAFSGEQEDYLNWFYTLPLYLELDDFRVVHACWQPEVIEKLKNRLVNDRLTPELLVEAGTKGTDFYNEVEVALKGPEVSVSEAFFDVEGNRREDARIRWWLDPLGLIQKQYYFRSKSENVIPPELESHWFYPKHEKPVFVGHYWMVGTPELASPNVCCVDYSIGLKGEESGAKLVAYRWDGGTLRSSAMVHVE